MRNIYSLFILLSLTFGMNHQLGASDYGNIHEYTMSAGQDLYIDLDYLFGSGHTDVRIYHAEGRFDFDVIDGASTFIICNLTPDDSGVMIIEGRGSDGNMYTYAVRLTIVELIDPTGINQIQTLNLLSYEE